MSTSVSVRMYRQGFGDCFLLTLKDDGADPHYVLIDCGVVEHSRVKDVVQEIATTTGGHLDVVAVTHDHADHVSGFQQAKDDFAPITLGELWFAWTEDDSDPVTSAIKKARGAKLAALSALASGAQAAGLTLSPAVGTALEFAGYAVGEGAPAVGRPGLGEIKPASSGMQDIRDHAKDAGAKILYRLPGEGPFYLDGVQGARFYVLGPPHDEKTIDATKIIKSGEDIYELTASLGADASFLSAAVARLTPPGQGDPWDDAAEMGYPFDVVHRLPYELGQDDKITPPSDDTAAAFFREHYSCGEDNQWRRIDSDWLGTAGQLAMRIDDDTNNTSLVLAVELVESGKVLLFPGDAQIESWQTWSACTFSFEEHGKKVERTGAELLGSVVFYKVGHHGSHNGTAKVDGLELMISHDLVAMIPTDPTYSKVVNQKTTGWYMPEEHVLAALESKTRGYVVQANPGDDNILPKGADPAFLKKLTVEDLYIEYVVTD